MYYSHYNCKDMAVRREVFVLNGVQGQGRSEGEEVKKEENTGVSIYLALPVQARPHSPYYLVRLCGVALVSHFC